MSPSPEAFSERMDDPTLPPEEAAAALDDLERVHRWVGHGALRRAIRPLLSVAGGRLRLLDVGTGSGVVAERIAGDAPRRTEIVLVGLDRKLSHLLIGRRRRPDQLRVVGDARRLPLRSGAVELSMSTLFQHHFDDADGSRVLAEMQRVSRIAAVVSDLRRSRLGALCGRLVLRLLRLGPIAAHDGAVSLRKAWSLDRVRSATGAETVVELRRRWPFRWSLVLAPGSAGGKRPYTEGG